MSEYMHPKRRKMLEAWHRNLERQAAAYVANLHRRIEAGEKVEPDLPEPPAYMGDVDVHGFLEAQEEEDSRRYEEYLHGKG